MNIWNVHRVLVPILQTLLWSVGLYSCTWNWNIQLNSNLNSIVFQGVCIVYLIFMIECIISLLDISCVHKYEGFNVKLLYWLMLFIGNVVMTLFLGLLLFIYADNTVIIGKSIIGMMCILKLINAWLNNNVQYFIEPIRVQTYSSTLKS